MNITEKRERIPDVMAIYIVAPTERNFQIIQDDLNKDIFDNLYINFVEKAEDHIFQTFFSNLISINKYTRIYKISVHPIGFLLYHPKLFTLTNIENSYDFLNKQNIKENELNNFYENIGKGLYNVLFTLKTLPVIKYRQNWFGDNIVSEIQEHFNHLFDKFPELKEEFPRKNNTVLIILDRDNDLPIMMHHAASLGSMINDLFGISRKKGTSNSTKFEIDPHVDYIWNNYITTDYPSAHSKVSDDLRLIINQTNFLKDENRDSGEMQKVSEQINETLDNIRDITITQTVLKNHAGSAEKLSNEIKSRFLENLYEFEYSMLSNRKVNSDSFKKLVEVLMLKSSNLNFKTDCLRIILMYYLINNKLSIEELSKIENLFVEYGIKRDSFDFLKQKKEFDDSVKKDEKEKETETGGFFNYFADKSKNLLRNVSSLMSSVQPSIVADLVNSLSTKKEVNNFVTYNLLKKSIDNNINTNFEQVIVFMVGGGSLAEYEYVDQLLLQNKKNVIYL